MMRNRLAVLAVALAFVLAPSALTAEERIALIIGNANYASSPLKNPRNDAELMAGTLKAVGFKVTTLIDADQKAMKRAMIAFGRKLRVVGNSVGLFYYAGHGVQVEGENFLIPIGADIADETEVGVEGVSVNDFLRTMERAASRINIAIFDACRNNPYARSFRSGTRGLARVDAPTGTIIGYATAPGQVALDGKTGNSPYTAALAAAIATPGLTVEEVFKSARRKVLSQTRRKQTPWESSSLTGDFFFKTGGSGEGGDSAPETASGDGQRLAELSYWDSVKDSGDAKALQSYLQRFPDGIFVDLAKLKLEGLEPERKIAVLPKATGDPADPTDAEALFRRALTYDAGEGVIRNKAEAARLYRKAAGLGHTGAMTNLGAMYEFGEGVVRNPQEAARWYRQAAEKGNARAMANLGVLYETGRGLKRDYKAAARLYRKAADLGSPRALNNLGVLYQFGRGVAQDMGQALAFYRQAAERGYPSAMHNIALLYDNGRGVERSDGEAAKWYERAAEKGHGPSMAVLGTMYEFGEGVPKNYREAFRWYREAAEKGEPLGMTRLAHMYSLGKGVRRNDDDALRWYRRAAERGMVQAMYNLGVLYELGRGVGKDVGEAARWYRKAADENFAAAKRGLAVLHDEGKGVPRDTAVAADYLLQAFRQGHKGARADLLQKFGSWSVGTRKQVQRQLKEAGLYAGPVTGRFDGNTRRALLSYARR